METTSLDAVLKSLCSLRLMEYDWDGAGGLPLRRDVDDTVFDTYDSVLRGLGIYIGLPMPLVTLNGNGTIEVAYDADDGRKLFLTFECLGVVTYIQVFEDDQTTIEGVVRLESSTDLDTFGELTELFDWISE